MRAAIVSEGGQHARLPPRARQEVRRRQDSGHAVPRPELGLLEARRDLLHPGRVGRLPEGRHLHRRARSSCGPTGAYRAVCCAPPVPLACPLLPQRARGSASGKQMACSRASRAGDTSSVPVESPLHHPIKVFRCVGASVVAGTVRGSLSARIALILVFIESTCCTCTHVRTRRSLNTRFGRQIPRAVGDTWVYF